MLLSLAQCGGSHGLLVVQPPLPAPVAQVLFAGATVADSAAVVAVIVIRAGVGIGTRRTLHDGRTVFVAVQYLLIVLVIVVLVVLVIVVLVNLFLLSSPAALAECPAGSSPLEVRGTLEHGMHGAVAEGEVEPRRCVDIAKAVAPRKRAGGAAARFWAEDVEYGSVSGGGTAPP